MPSLTYCPERLAKAGINPASTCAGHDAQSSGDKSRRIRELFRTIAPGTGHEVSLSAFCAVVALDLVQEFSCIGKSGGWQLGCHGGPGIGMAL